MESPAHSKKQIIYYSGTHRHKRANSAFLMGGFLVVMLGWTPEEAFRPFMGTYIHARYRSLSRSLALTLSCCDVTFQAFTRHTFHFVMPPLGCAPTHSPCSTAFVLYTRWVREHDG